MNIAPKSSLLKKIIFYIVYAIVIAYLLLIQLIALVFNPVWSQTEVNVSLGIIMYIIHGLIFVGFVSLLILFTKKIKRHVIRHDCPIE